MLLKDTNTGTRKFNGQATSGRLTRDLLATEDSTISTPPRVAIVSGTPSGTETFEDSVLNVYDSVETLTTIDVIVSAPLNRYATGPVTYSSSNPSVATIDSAGVVTPVGPGTTVITATIPGLNSRQVTLNVVETTGTTTAFYMFVSGSLGDHLAGQANGLIMGKTPPADLPSYTSAPPFSLLNIFNSDGTRNSGFYGNGISNITCIPNGGVGCCLITPQDIIGAAHADASPSYTFVDMEGNTYVRNVVAKGGVGDYGPPGPGDGFDILVAHLDSPLPTAYIQPAQFMPTNFRSYLPQPQYGYPVVFTNQDLTLVFGDMIVDSPNYLIGQPSDPTRAQWWYQVRTGDSGHPYFHLINNTLVVMGNWYTAGTGPIDADNLAPISNALYYQGSPYYDELPTIPLSTFPTYP